MSLKPWKKISEETLVENQWWKFKHDSYVTPTGVSIDYYYGDIPPAIMVIPMNKEGRLGMIRQYRVLFDSVSLEFPAGGVDKEDEGDLEGATLRELKEEMNVGANTLIKLGKLQDANARLNQYMYYYLATDLTDEALESDPGEEFEREWFTIEEIHGKISSGEIEDGITVTAFHLLLSHLDKINL